MKSGLRKLTIAGLSAFILATPPPIFAAAETPLPFATSETLHFTVHWSLLKVGEAVMEVCPNTIVGGRPVRHFRLSIRTTPLIDALYKVRTRVDAYTELDMSRSVHYRKRQEEGGVTRDVTVAFDWDTQTAAHAEAGSVTAETAVRPGTLDPLAILYHFRTLDLARSDRFERPVTDGKICETARLTVLENTHIKTGGRVYETYMARPEPSAIDGVFDQSRDARITLWFQKNPPHMPVKIKLEVLIGSVVCRLVPPEETTSGNR